MNAKAKKVERIVKTGANGELLGAGVRLASGVELVVMIADLSEEIRTQAMIHGLKQKLGDATSQYTKDNNLAGMEAEVSATIDSLHVGDWNRRGGFSGGSDLAEALAKVTGKPLDVVVAMLAGKDDDEKKALAKHPAVAAAILALKAERAQGRADTAPDLGGLFG
jgi:hypothetical protein